jgi:uncharacterized protein (DUF433 family)
MAEPTPTYVTRTAEGSYRVTDTRVSLDSVVRAYWDGQLPEAIAIDFPSLSLVQVYGAITYYLQHRSEIDAYLTEQDGQWREFREESDARNAPLIRRLRG